MDVFKTVSQAFMELLQANAMVCVYSVLLASIYTV